MKRHYLYSPGDKALHKKLGDALALLEPGEYVVEVRKNRAVRSLDANKYYHAILNMIGIETGHTHQELHKTCKRMFNSDTTYKEDGTTQIYVNSTSDLDTKEFAAYVNNVKHWAMEQFNMVIPDARDMNLHRWLEVESEYERVHSGM